MMLTGKWGREWSMIEGTEDGEAEKQSRGGFRLRDLSLGSNIQGMV